MHIIATNGDIPLMAVDMAFACVEASGVGGNVAVVLMSPRRYDRSASA